MNLCSLIYKPWILSSDFGKSADYDEYWKSAVFKIVSISKTAISFANRIAAIMLYVFDTDYVHQETIIGYEYYTSLQMALQSHNV